jgi:hypothetical protein
LLELPGPLLFAVAGKRGTLVAVSEEKLSQLLKEFKVDFPRYHCGRHLLRSFLLVNGMSYIRINAIMGHEFAGWDPYSKYSNFGLLNCWRKYLGLADKLATELGW